MPKAYLIAHIRAHNFEKMKEFGPLARPAIAKFGGTVLVTNLSPTIKEGPDSGIAVLSRDSRVAQRIGVSFSIQCCDGNVDVTIEMLWVSEGLMGEVVGLEIEPDAFDVIEFGGIFWQPFDRQPVSAFS